MGRLDLGAQSGPVGSHGRNPTVEPDRSSSLAHPPSTRRQSSLETDEREYQEVIMRLTHVDRRRRYSLPYGGAERGWARSAFLVLRRRCRIIFLHLLRPAVVGRESQR